MISAIYCAENIRQNKIEKTQHILESNVDDDIKGPSLEGVAKLSTLNYPVPKSMAEDILRRLANLTISVKLGTNNNDTFVDDFLRNQSSKGENNDDKEILRELSALDYLSKFKQNLLKTNIIPIYETHVPKLQLKFLDEAMKPQQNNFTRSVVINKNNDTFHNHNPGLKLKVKLSKKGNNNDNNDIPFQYAIINSDNKYTNKNVYPDIKEGKKDETESLPKRSVPGFNIENKAGANFNANSERKMTENVQYLPIQYHVPVLRQFQINQAPLPPPSLPPAHTLPKFVPVYQNDDLPLHFHAPDPSYSTHLETISQGNSLLNQFQNVENYFKLRDNNQRSGLKGLEKGDFDDENGNSYLYEQYGISVPRGHSVDEGSVKVNPIRKVYTDISNTQRDTANKNEEFLDAHIKISKNLFEHYRPQVIETLKSNVENETINDFISLFPQVRGNVSYHKDENITATRDTHISNSTDSLGIDTLIKQFLIDPGLAKEQTENLFPKLISILGPEFSKYFGENLIPAGKIDNEIKKLQNTLETLRKWREFSKNVTSTKTHSLTTRLPIVNRTYLTESTSKESQLNNEFQTLNTNSQIQRYKTTVLNENTSSTAPTIESAEHLNNSDAVSNTTYLEIDITTKYAKTTTLKPDNNSHNPLHLQINKEDLGLQDGSGLIKNKKATLEEIKNSLDRFTMERKETFTSTPNYLETIPEVREEEEKVHIKDIQPDTSKNSIQNWKNTPNLGLIGKVLNENYILLSQQSEKNNTTSILPETIEIEGNDDDIIDPKYISENPEVFDSLRQQTGMMGKLLLNYKKHSGRKKNKADNRQPKDNNMEDFEALINKLDEDFLTKSTNNKEVSAVSTIKKLNSSVNSDIGPPKIAYSNEKPTNNKNKNKHSNEDSTENKKSSIELGSSEAKHTKHNQETEKLTKEISNKKDNSEEIATEKSSKEMSSTEISSKDEKVVRKRTRILKTRTRMARNKIKQALLRNPDLLKILRYCKSQKRKNRQKRNF